MSIFFFQGSINRLNCSQNIVFIQISLFLWNYIVKHLKCFRTRKYISEYKYEGNLSLVWLYLANVTFYLNCLERVALTHPFWALATFPICFSFLSCAHSVHIQFGLGNNMKKPAYRWRANIHMARIGDAC